MAQAAEKVLRIGVLQNGRIVEERLIHKRQAVTMGEAARNVIVLPENEALGSSFKLFDLSGNRYVLGFAESSKGRVSVRDQVQDLSMLRSSGKAKKSGDHYALEVEEGTRGKVSFGDVTVLFQFVDPPKAPAPLVLPAAMRSNPLRDIDSTFASAFGVATVLFVAAIAYLRTVPIPEITELSQIEDRFVKMIAPEYTKPKVEDKGTDVKKAETKTEEKKAEKKEEKPAEDNEAAKQARKKEIQQKVGNKGVLAILGTLGKGTAKGAVADVFGDGKAVAGDLEGAFAGLGGIEVATGNNTTSRGGTGSGTSASIGGLATSGSGKVGLSEKSEARVGNVQSAAPEVDGGSLDPGAIAKVVKSRLTAVKECYERELKRNPQLAGKVVIRFTIEDDGRVSNVAVEEQTLGDPNVGSCIVSRFERFRFPKPDGGAVTVSYPFIFSPAS